MKTQTKYVRRWEVELTNEMVRDSRIDPEVLVLKMLRDKGWRPVMRPGDLYPVKRITSRPNFYFCEAIYTGTEKAGQAPLIIPDGSMDVTLQR